MRNLTLDFSKELIYGDGRRVYRKQKSVDRHLVQTKSRCCQKKGTKRYTILHVSEGIQTVFKLKFFIKFLPEVTFEVTFQWKKKVLGNGHKIAEIFINVTFLSRTNELFLSQKCLF